MKKVKIIFGLIILVSLVFSCGSSGNDSKTNDRNNAKKEQMIKKHAEEVIYKYVQASKATGPLGESIRILEEDLDKAWNMYESDEDKRIFNHAYFEVLNTTVFPDEAMGDVLWGHAWLIY